MMDTGKDYPEKTLAIINEAKIIDPEDKVMLEEYAEELKDVFMHSQVFRTRTEMDVSVLNEVHFPTPDSKYWQCVREQNVMFQELVNLSYEYRKKNVQIRQLKKKIESEMDEDEKELKQIELESMQFGMKNMERTAKDRIREIREWHEIKANLIPQLKYSTTDVNEHQLFSYAKRFIAHAKLMGTSGSPAENQNLVGQLVTTLKTIDQKGLTEKFIASLPESDKATAIANFQEIKLLEGRKE